MVDSINKLEHAKEKLLKLFSENKGSNAFLLSAPQGSGKMQFVQEIAQEILDSEELYNSNLFLVSSSNNKILVSQVRDIYEFLSKTSYNNKPRLVVIDAADYLNMQASNALLKILEDCDSNTFFMVLCHNISKVLRTVRSRCVTIRIPYVKLETKEGPDRANCLYLAGGISGISEYMQQQSGLEFYKDILNVIDQMNKDIKVLYKFLDTNFTKENNENRVRLFALLMEHFVSVFCKYGVSDNPSALDEEVEVLDKLSCISEDKRVQIYRDVTDLLDKSHTCSLSFYNVALVSFLKIRGV